MRGVCFCLFFALDGGYSHCCVSFCCTHHEAASVRTYPLPLEPSSHSPQPTPLGGHRAPSFAAQQIPTIYTRECIQVNAGLSICPLSRGLDLFSFFFFFLLIVLLSKSSCFSYFLFFNWRTTTTILVLLFIASTIRLYAEFSYWHIYIFSHLFVSISPYIFPLR